MNARILQLTTPHLQADLTVQAYESLIRESLKETGRLSILDLDDVYWQRMPIYTVARCPLCKADYTERLDTYSLRGWHTAPYNDQEVYDLSPTRCEHFVAVQTFITLNGLMPTELSYYHSHTDIPYVMPVFLPTDYAAFAVLHSLPICRTEQGRFVPSYSAFMLTYYAADPQEMERRKRAKDDAFYGPDTDAYVTPLDTRGDTNLRGWVERGKLLWLDLAAPDLALKAGPPEQFPYVDIKGYGQPYTIRYGKVELHF